ncbi:MAG: DUF1800 domain-containing protein [Cyanobacteria bacterium J06581_3]
MDSSQKITHILERLSLGARPSDRQQVNQLGIDGYIQAQLNPSDNGEPASLRRTLDGFSTLDLSPVEMFDRYSPTRNPSDAQRTDNQRKRRTVLHEAKHFRIRQALENPNQLKEVMTDFWFNHFNVFIGNNLTHLWTVSYERTAIRPYALGRFRDMLGATAKHPAMSLYLDNWRNTDPQSSRAKGAYRGLNENYARELMELHTLGVDGGYTQADVESLTRILTGWGMTRGTPASREASDGQNNHQNDGSGFLFEPERHDSSNKTLLGQAIPGGGIEEGERALDILAQHPSTARHISYKLAQYFVSDVPPDGLVNRLADRFLSTDGNIKAVLQQLFESDEFWADTHYQQKFKTPYQYILSTARALGVENPNDTSVDRLIGGLDQLGMPVYGCRTPDGYAQVASVWLNADAMLRRVNYVRLVVGMKDPKPDSSTLVETLGGQFSAQTMNVVNNSRSEMQLALMLGSPEMMYR